MTDSGLWWAVWWPWVLLWGGAVSLALAATVVLVVLVRTRRVELADNHGALRRNHVHGQIWYLDNDAVMDTYRGNNSALRSEVERRITSSKGAVLGLVVPGVDAKGEASVSQEVVTKFVQEAEPITVVRLVVDILDREHNIVHVDLRHQRVPWHTAREKLLAQGPGGGDTRLSDMVGVYVSISAVLHRDPNSEEGAVFLAPYGTGKPGEGPTMRVRCVLSGLRVKELPMASAQCVGKVVMWDDDRLELVVDPLVIFR
ncbi:hypothetical protein [Actinokineospora sp. NBRC 105648]|uniref:hypothetical protein n=1 Tax=Actinokineospora sp. NBRC 105648 TaxID=3032206 RepID=UPI0024A1917B|nr:hypothetical protein [Actinokineospora sp. NBRC 105648]GLZ39919.1 hypothetical protein Acsp05_35430 [Actinokineospora sp. NBRC 105648]